MRYIGRVTLVLTVMLLLLVSNASLALAQQVDDIEIDSPIRGLEIDPTRSRVDLDVNLFNRTEERRTVSFALEGIPEGWEIGLWSRFFDFRITELVVEPTAANPDRLQQVRIRIVPPSDPPAETHSFTLRVFSADGSVEYETATYTIRVRESTETPAGPFTVRTDNPTLVGTPTETLGFEIRIGNSSGDESSYTLGHEAPSGWQVTFREPFGERRVIGAVSVSGTIAERVRVDVRPPAGIALGQYDIPIVVTSEQGSETVMLRAAITGRGEVRATTPTGLLSLRARAGGEGSTTLRLTNNGSADLNDIRLVAEAPANWNVTFDVPNGTVASLPAANQIDVPVRISPPPDAISGDYVVTIRANTSESNTSTNFRVTVEQSTIWGWLGIGLVVLVVGGMIGLFLKLGRR